MRQRLFLGLLVVVFSVACASVPEDPNAPRACVVVDNTQGGGPQAQIFLRGVDSGFSQYMGEAGTGRTLRFCTRRPTFPERAVVVVERPAAENIDPAIGQNQARAIQSKEFLLSAWDVCTWEVTLNRVVCVPNSAGTGVGDGG